ncbi:GPI-anchored protein LLG1-like isoform X2 [Primulina tabacum]|uniref:GPI-anchored protein LLG1-like isoform X2 n=1 Tax=Primulina tabacum TaxID=48773 RepID=UPI003F5906DB
MGLCGMKCCLFVIVFLDLSTSFEASPFISDGIFGSHDSGERRLLQRRTPCPASFEFQNYTIITSKCKGPEYPPDLCCSSFKEFACLFASICREGKDGLECPGVPPPSMLSENANKNLSRNIRELLPITMLMVASLALTLQYF